MFFWWQKVGMLETKLNHSRTFRTSGHMWVHYIRSYITGSKTKLTPKPKACEGLWCGYHFCLGCVSTRFFSLLYTGPCSNVTSQERPSLISSETESQKSSHSLTLTLLFFLLALIVPWNDVLYLHTYSCLQCTCCSPWQQEPCRCARLYPQHEGQCRTSSQEQY